MFRYACSLAGENNARDVVHSLWLKYMDKTGLNLLEQQYSNRWLYKSVRNEYFNQYKRLSRYTEMDLETHLHINNVVNDIEGEERDKQFKATIFNLLQSKHLNSQSKRNKTYDIEKQYRVFISIYELMKLEYSTKDISKSLEISEQLVSYYKKQIQSCLKMADLRNPFNGSKLKVTRRVSLKTWQEKIDHSDYDLEDENEYYAIYKHKESEEGLLIRLPDQKVNPYIK